MTKNQIAFQAEVKRLEKIANKLLKQGFIFTEPPIPEMPKRVTQKQLRIIKSISPREIKSKAELPTNENAISAYTPTKVEPSKRRKKQNTKSKYKTKRKRTSKKKTTLEFQTEQETYNKSVPFTEARRNLQIAREILKKAYLEIENFKKINPDNEIEEGPVYAPTMQEMLDKAIALYGENEVAKRLETIADFQTKFYKAVYVYGYGGGPIATYEAIDAQIEIYQALNSTVLSPEEIHRLKYDYVDGIDINELHEYRRNKYIDDDETALKDW